MTYILSLMETLCCRDKLDAIKIKMGYEGLFVAVEWAGVLGLHYTGSLHTKSTY